MLFDKTPELIKNCDLVISHYSTAFCLAVYFDKPVYIISTNEFQHSEISRNIEKCASWFETNPINIDHLDNQKFSLPEVKEKIYHRYYIEFLEDKKSSGKSIWQTMITANEANIGGTN